MGFSMYSKGKVHPWAESPHPQPLPTFLPETVITLSIAMPPEDQEVLFYLIAYSLNVFSTGSQNLNQKEQGKYHGKIGGGKSSSSFQCPHEVSFECNCFECYMGFWGRWNGSANRDLIHKGMEIFEENMEKGGLNGGKSVTNGRKMKAKEEKKLQAKELISWLESNTDLIGGGGKQRKGVLLFPKNEEEEKDSDQNSNNSHLGFGDGDGPIRMRDSRNPNFVRRMLPDFMGFLNRLS